MENFEKCTVAMLGVPCSQHVTGNTSRLNQPQSAIKSYNSRRQAVAGVTMEIKRVPVAVLASVMIRFIVIMLKPATYISNKTILYMFMVIYDSI